MIRNVFFNKTRSFEAKQLKDLFVRESAFRYSREKPSVYRIIAPLSLSLSPNSHRSNTQRDRIAASIIMIVIIIIQSYFIKHELCIIIIIYYYRERRRSRSRARARVAIYFHNLFSKSELNKVAIFLSFFIHSSLNIHTSFSFSCLFSIHSRRASESASLLSTIDTIAFVVRGNTRVRSPRVLFKKPDHSCARALLLLISSITYHNNFVIEVPLL